MTVQIIINAETAAEAMAEARTLADYNSKTFVYGGPEAGTTSEAETAASEASAKADKPEKPKRTRRTKAEIEAEKLAQAETTDTKEDEAQDAKDEAADPANQSTVLTFDDVRKALSAYVQKFGIAAAQEDGVKLFAKAGVEAKRVSDIPDDQGVLSKVVATIDAATVENPFGRTKV